MRPGSKAPAILIMQIEFYKNMSAKTYVDKNLQFIRRVQGQAKEPFNYTNPIFMVQGRPNVIENYAYIPGTNRYYYVNNVTVLSGDKYQIELSVDVLMTYRDTIKNGYGFVTRAQSDLGLKLTNAGVNQPGYDTFVQYGSVFNGPDFVPDGGMYILVVAG